jgi:hypothetical protein
MYLSFFLVKVTLAQSFCLATQAVLHQIEDEDCLLIST